MDTVIPGVNGMDFCICVDSDKPFRILQLTDTQIIDAAQCRYAARLTSVEKAAYATERMEENCFRYIRRAVERTRPHLIIFTGDIVYGEFDDSGRTLEAVIRFLDSLGVPWAPVFGNHDNESLKGIDWQCDQLTCARNTIFRRGAVSGNGNYTIGITSNGKLVRRLYLMDSHGCGTEPGFRQDQLQWMEQTAQKAPGVPTFLFCHIPPEEFVQAVRAAESDSGNSIGVIGENWEGWSTQDALAAAIRAICCDGVFVGHYHKNSLSVCYQGTRWTFGLKTGTYDYHDPEQLGSTLITLSADSRDFYVSHQYSNPGISMT